MSIASTLLAKVTNLKAGAVFCANDFRDLGNNGAIDVNLHRLAKSGIITRLGYGLYYKPRKSPLLGYLKPDITQVMKAYARRTGQAISLDPQGAANALSLTTQVPAQMTFLTNGKSHTMQIGDLNLKLIHTSPKKLMGAGTHTGIIIQALRYYGKSQMPNKSFQSLIKHLSQNDINALRSIRNKTLRQIIPHIDRILAHAKIH